jgi:hypothetical protein
MKQFEIGGRGFVTTQTNLRRRKNTNVLKGDSTGKNGRKIV